MDKAIQVGQGSIYVRSHTKSGYVFPYNGHAMDFMMCKQILPQFLGRASLYLKQTNGSAVFSFQRSANANFR